jgi:hypothetical protein
MGKIIEKWSTRGQIRNNKVLGEDKLVMFATSFNLKSVLSYWIASICHWSCLTCPKRAIPAGDGISKESTADC